MPLTKFFTSSFHKIRQLNVAEIKYQSRKFSKINCRSHFSSKILRHYPLASFSDSHLHTKLFALNKHIDIASHRRNPCCPDCNAVRLVDVMSSNCHSIHGLAYDDSNSPTERICKNNFDLVQ